MASTVTLRDARLCISSGFCAGQTKATSTCPSRIRPTSSAPGARTLKMMSASHGSETISAPAARYASSEKLAASPAPDCTATRKPSLISFSTTSGTVATRFSPAAVSRGTAISCDMSFPCSKGAILAGARPRHPPEAALAELEGALHEERDPRGRDRAGEQRHVVVQRQPARNALAIAAGTDERRDGGGADVDHRRGLDARQDRGCGERQLDQAQALRGLQAERHRRLSHAAADRREPGVRVAHDRQQCVEEEGEQRRRHADRPDQRDE